jgi:transcriptional regulator with GAF, ATPase, and Fis domain
MSLVPNMLDDIVMLLQRGLDTSETFQSVMNILERVVDYHSATLFLYDEKTQQLKIMYQVGEEPVELGSEFAIGFGSGVSGWMASQNKPIILESLEKTRAGREQRFYSFASLPLRVGDKLIGVLNLGHQIPMAYKKGDQNKFIQIASQISLVLEQIRLRQTLEKQNKMLEKALTELREAQKTVIEKERLAAIGEIVVTVNHEINNPLTSILGLAEILLMTWNVSSPEKNEEALHIILNEARRIKKVTHKLSNLSSSASDTYVGGVKMTRL